MARGQNAGSIRIDIVALTARFHAAVKQARTRLQALRKTASRIARSMQRNFRGAALAVGGMTAAIGVAIKTMTAYSSKVVEVSRNVGITTRTLENFRALMVGDGLNIKQADKALEAFNRRIGQARTGTGAAGKALDNLGISLRNQAGEWKSNDVLLKEVTEKLHSMGDEQLAAAAAADLFSDVGKKMVATLMRTGASYDQAMAAAGRYFTLSDKQHELNKEIDQKFTDIKANLLDFKNRILAEFAPEIETLATHFNEWISSMKNPEKIRTFTNEVKDLADQVVRIAGAVAGLMVGATLGKIGEPIGAVAGAAIGASVGAFGPEVVAWLMGDAIPKSFEDQIKANQARMDELLLYDHLTKTDAAEYNRLYQENERLKREAIAAGLPNLTGGASSAGGGSSAAGIYRSRYAGLTQGMINLLYGNGDFSDPYQAVLGGSGRPGTASGSFVPLDLQYLRSDTQMRSPAQASTAANLYAAELARARTKRSIEITQSELKRQMRAADIVPPLRIVIDMDLGSGQRSAQLVPDPSATGMPAQRTFLSAKQLAADEAAIWEGINDRLTSLAFEQAKKQRLSNESLAVSMEMGEQAGEAFVDGLLGFLARADFKVASESLKRTEDAIAKGNALRQYDLAAFRRARERGVEGPISAWNRLRAHTGGDRGFQSRLASGRGAYYSTGVGGARDAADAAMMSQEDAIRQLAIDKWQAQVDAFNEKMKETDKITDKVTNSLDRWSNGLFDNFTNLRDALEDLLVEIGKMLVEHLVTNKFAGFFGGLVGSVFSGLPFGGPSVSPRTLASNGWGGQAAANGGMMSGLTLVGERGPELVDFASPAMVTSNERIRAAMGGGGGITIVNNISSTDGPGVTKALNTAMPGFVAAAQAATLDMATRPSPVRGAIRGIG